MVQKPTKCDHIHPHKHCKDHEVVQVIPTILMTLFLVHSAQISLQSIPQILLRRGRPDMKLRVKNRPGHDELYESFCVESLAET